MAKSNEIFKFIVHKPSRNMLGGYTQRLTISTQAPHMYGIYEMSKYLPAEEALRLLKAELKLGMMEALLKGEWEFEK